MFFLVAYLLVGIIFALVGAKMARTRQRDPAIWAIVCFLFPLIGILALLVAGGTSDATAGLSVDQRHKWKALCELDPDIREVAERAREHGKKYEDLLAVKYLALNEKTYLRAAEDAVAKQIDADNASAAQRLEKVQKK